jgi:hypothetical protein
MKSNASTTDSAGREPKKEQLTLPPDTAILIEARIKAGEPNLQVKAIANLILHDPILTLEFLQYANSVMFGGASVTEVEGAVNRIGSDRMKALLSKLNSSSHVEDKEVLAGFEILRYNCRRISMLCLIVSAVTRPQLTTMARTVGLLADVGHMLALHALGSKYLELARANRRQTLAFRLQKDLKFDLVREHLKFLASKGVPRTLLAALDPDGEVKGKNEADLRLIIRSALELIDAFDTGKLTTYIVGKELPASSTLRLFKVSPAQQERVLKASHDYLRTVVADEAPEGTSLLLSSADADDAPAPESVAGAGADAIRIPTYPNMSVLPESREALKEFFVLCEEETDIERLKRKSIEHLKESGLFDRTALLEVASDGTKVSVIHECGMPLHSGAVIPIKDETSPFRALRLEIKSANVRGDFSSVPFGSGAYALGPLDVLASGERIAVYADKAGSEALNMDARRAFRLALGLLMETIRELKEPAGGAPVAS